jgi:hypothetical protein
MVRNLFERCGQVIHRAISRLRLYAVPVQPMVPLDDLEVLFAPYLGQS